MFTELEMRKAEEYEMQLFGFNSRAVCATLDRVVEEKIEMCCKKLSESLNKIYKPDEDTSTLRFDVKSLIKAYHSHSHHHARIMKKCIRKLIAVPPNILLDEDECQAVTYSQGFQDMGTHLQYLQSRARKATVLHAALKDELGLIVDIASRHSVAEEVSTVIENSLIQPDVDPEMIKCISSCHVLKDMRKKSNSEAANIYADDMYNVRINELDLDISQPNV